MGSLIFGGDGTPYELGSPTDNPSEDTVYNDSTEMSTFLPVGQQQQQEIEAIRTQLSANEPMTWPVVSPRGGPPKNLLCPPMCPPK